MADKNGNKHSSVNYNRKRTRLEEELISRGYKDRDMWVLVCANRDGKKFNKDELDAIFDKSTYRLGIQAIENLAMACDVSYMTVVDWVRLDMYPEKMTKTQFEIYKKRLTELSNADHIRWYMAMLIRKGLPIIQVVDAAANGYEFKKEGYRDKKLWVFEEIIKKGQKIDPSLRKQKDS